ncbi:lytic transglycosylase domain-containing protein [Palleronia sp. LCG004]|uniref:lytic transglycosylase domain-containing protein n=1 Tax=Palleronia sp. LCG004 TaxID=3079304 RepID=UPI002942BA67|nr:lytic transglycosylase domain-containing protein [Palleronia sp. LCG004]WOI56031.1 lytic transglycosylase domain-containing protein [Palleronia sp. LCG004]
MSLSVPMIAATMVWAQPPDLDAIEGDPSRGLARAFEDLSRGSFTDAIDAAGLSGPVARDVIEWIRLRDGRGTFEEALGFLRRNPDWPGLDLLRRRSEETVPPVIADDATAQDVVDFFGGAEPVSGAGTLALVRAYRQLGREGDAEAQAALAWVERSLGEGAEDTLLAFYPDALRALESARADQMFWDGADAALRRAIGRDLPEEARQRAAVRLAARGGGLPADLSPEMAADPGVTHLQFRAAMDARDHDRAIAILRRQSVSAETLGRPDAWARDRRDLVRRQLRAGNPEIAYDIAAHHWLSEGASFADLEWLSGFLALRYLERPDVALAHFERFGAAVGTPISLGRAGYWTGRAYEALGRQAEARSAYERGAEHQTSFYGLLAAEKLGQPLDPELMGLQTYPPMAEAAFRGSTVLEAGLALQAAGQRDLAERFLTHLSESLDEEEIGTLAQLVLDLGEPHIAVMIAKRAAEGGITLPRPYYPVVEMGVAENPVELALALSIARRESEFDPGVASGVGARGLMQLMPGTARDVARGLGLPYSSDRLFSDPGYNATLGTAYLAGLIERFGDNPVLVSSGYNAGPGRPSQWIAANGDPREDTVDVIDWIELIPFDETRNYAMRVAESMPVYRARLTGEAGALHFTEMLKGR